MHIVTLPERIVLSPQDIIEPGDYIVENLNGAQLINLCGDGGMKPLEETRPFDETKDWNGKRLLFVRVGGFGDIVNMTPIFREVRRRWPACSISISTMTKYAAVLENLPYIDQVLNYPVAVEDAATYDAWIFFEKAIEKNPRAEKVHMTDLFAEITGLKGGTPGLRKLIGAAPPALDDPKPEYVVSNDEMSWVLVQFPRKPGIRRLCVQVGASASCRVYPVTQLGLIVGTLVKNGWEVFLLGERGEVKVESKGGLQNLADMGLTFRQSAAVVNNADCFLGNDSSLLHVAGALGIPAVGLFGPFPWKLRTAYSPSVRAIQGNNGCKIAPCFHHENPTRHDAFPKDCPSKEKGYCEVLASIEPKTIIAKIEKIAKKFELSALN